MTARYPLAELKDLPDDIRAAVLEVQDKAGFVPNVFLALARRPAEWRAFFAYHDALMQKEEGSLTKGDREMIVTATSAANQCLYCVVAHGALLRHVTGGHIETIDAGPRSFQPMNINFGLFPPLGGGAPRDSRKRALCERALTDLDCWIAAAVPQAAE